MLAFLTLVAGLLPAAIAYVGKLMVHPVAVPDFATFVARADIGPVPGLLVLLAGACYLSAWAGLALWVTAQDRRRGSRPGRTMG